ncbi:caspase family protein, partial [Desertibaculum subflavum]|uniref:caspase family protein n=1 Tax=Desertibaculum subflavum TaxID=2268458 RepID=UPI0013C3FBB7
MRFLGFVVAVLVSVLAGAPGALAQAGLDFGRYVALVIGNNDYRHLPKLKTAVGDARAVADLLKARYGFEVELLLNADRDAIIRAVNGYRSKLRDADSLLIYYAGHGLIDEATDRGFWLPIDAEKENEARWVDVAVISSNLRAMQARHILVVADSCYSGSLVRAAEQTGIPSGGERTMLLQRMRERRARVALTSGSLEPVVDSGGSGHSVFAGALLTLLRENAEIVSASELFARLRARVVANAQQTPLYSDIRFAGHEGGDFIFVPRGATIAGAAPAAPTASDAQAALELAFWNSIKDSAAADDYQAYLEAFPGGRFAPLARRRVEVAMAARPAQRPSNAPAPAVAVAPARPAPAPPPPTAAAGP